MAVRTSSISCCCQNNLARADPGLRRCHDRVRCGLERKVVLRGLQSRFRQAFAVLMLAVTAPPSRIQCACHNQLSRTETCLVTAITKYAVESCLTASGQNATLAVAQVLLAPVRTLSRAPSFLPERVTTSGSPSGRIPAFTGMTGCGTYGW